jgi:putative ABC transport system permease protein
MSVMLRKSLKVAFWNLLRHQLFSFLNIIGLAVGLACCLLLLLFVHDELSYDRDHRHADRIYRVADHFPSTVRK